MGEAVNSKKLLTKSYASWRVVQAPGAWAQVYRERFTLYSRYRSAIIFPEQLLGLNQTSIYMAKAFNGATGGGQSGLTASITATRDFGLWAHHYNIPILSSGNAWMQLKTVEQVYAFEEHHNDATAFNFLVMQEAQTSRYGNRTSFNDIGPLFTNKHDAVKFVSTYLEKQVGNL